MAGRPCWLIAIILSLMIGIGAHATGEVTPNPGTTGSPAAVTEDAVRLLELGKLLMGQNNPEFATTPLKLSPEARNTAGEQALRTFQSLVKLKPQYADGWLWLGLALTETLHYSKEHPEGESVLDEARITDGLSALRIAYQQNPANLTYVCCYSDALMAYRKDFDAARKLWDRYLPIATSDCERVTALIQAGRACLNKAFFGKTAGMPTEEVRGNYQAAVNYVQQAARLLPKSENVREMQELLRQHRKTLSK